MQKILFVLTLCLFPIVALAQEVAPPVDAAAALENLINSLAGLKGAGALAISAFVVQVIMRLLNTKLGDVAGKWKLLIVYVLSVVSGVLGLKAAGLDIGAALVHAQTLAAFQVLANQVYKQFIKKA